MKSELKISESEVSESILSQKYQDPRWHQGCDDSICDITDNPKEKILFLTVVRFQAKLDTFITLFQYRFKWKKDFVRGRVDELIEDNLIITAHECPECGSPYIAHKDEYSSEERLNSEILICEKCSSFILRQHYLFKEYNCLPWQTFKPTARGVAFFKEKMDLFAKILNC